METQEFAAVLKYIKQELRQERLQHRQAWLPKVTSDLRDTSSRLIALKADLARAMDMPAPARNLLALAPRIKEMLDESHTLLSQVEHELESRQLWEQDVAENP